MKVLILAILIILSGCSKIQGTYIYNKTSIEGNTQAAEFILSCIRFKNQVIDEDVVRECKWTAQEIYGKKVYYASTGGVENTCFSESYQETSRCVERGNK